MAQIRGASAPTLHPTPHSGVNTTTTSAHLPHVAMTAPLALALLALVGVLYLKWRWSRPAHERKLNKMQRRQNRTNRKMFKAFKQMNAQVTSQNPGAQSYRPQRSGGLVTWVFRFVSGAPLDGVARSDAGFFRGATRDEGEDKAGGWHDRPQAIRAGIRLGALALVVSSVYAYMTAPAASTAQYARAAVVLGCILAGLGGYRLVDWTIRYRHLRDWVKPLHHALREHVGYDVATSHRHYIAVPRNFTELSGDAIRIQLPANFHGDATKQQLITQVVRTKLALQDVVFRWHLDGRNHFVSVVQAPRPRTKALFTDSDVRRLVESSPESSPLIGLSHRDKRVAVDMDAESPHILVSASTGGGKSVILRTIFSQQLHNGALGVVLDFKRHSHKWVRGVPGVDYHRDIADIHDALIALGEEGHRRNRIVDDWEGEDDRDAPVGPRLSILLEECNATISKLKKYWASIRTKEDPKASPALDALGEILFMGRAVKMHVLMVAQSATANALGGPEMRECFSTRILARYTQNAWRMLVPEVFPIPKSTRHVGRAQVVLGGVAQETQVIFFTPQEAREYAMAGRVMAPTGGGEGLGVSGVSASQGASDMGQDRSDVLGRSGSHLTVVPDLPEELSGISLAQAVEDKVVSCSLGALRKASTRDPEFPASVGAKGSAKLYNPEALMRWDRNRIQRAAS